MKKKSIILIAAAVILLCLTALLAAVFTEDETPVSTPAIIDDGESSIYQPIGTVNDVVEDIGGTIVGSLPFIDQYQVQRDGGRW